LCDAKPLPGNRPLSEAELACNPLAGLQGIVDRARRLQHQFGMRPYRLFMIWAERRSDGEWYTVREIELVPCRVIALDGVDLELSQAGLQPEGSISVREVSPAQVTEDMLLGMVDGERWGAGDTAREFYFELRLGPACAGPAGGRRRRFVLGAEPHYDAENFQWRLGLVDQAVSRSRVGEDRSIQTKPGQRQRPRIVP